MFPRDSHVMASLSKRSAGVFIYIGQQFVRGQRSSVSCYPLLFETHDLTSFNSRYIRFRDTACVKNAYLTCCHCTRHTV